MLVKIVSTNIQAKSVPDFNLFVDMQIISLISRLFPSANTSIPSVAEIFYYLGIFNKFPTLHSFYNLPMVTVNIFHHGSQPFESVCLLFHLPSLFFLTCKNDNILIKSKNKNLIRRLLYLIFSVARPIKANNIAAIQKRIVIWLSGIPFFS